ncbi:histamine H3 receptor-like [Rhinatrema bivittatum]|uniref:histamine H3 receptor-like n=1 Tax=Rhinatrema bivittatum TaxID=194408 RepID=UPI00112B5D66|nr:histamine H3 receptor-like [Rhinatrema bivittatum]
MQSNNLSSVSKVPWEDFSSTKRLIVSVFLSLAVGVAVLGNSLVIVVFVIDRKLKSQSNFLLLNLAICDFLVGSFILPIYITYVLNGKWILGRRVCKLWLAINYSTCLTSVFSIVLISHDRFLSVTNAIAYRAQQGITSRAFVKMFIAWILSFLIYTPAISCWDIIVGFSVIPDGECTPEFSHNRYFRFFACSVDFFLPFSVIIYFNLNIYLTINKHEKSKKSKTDKNKMKTSGEDSTEDIFYVTTDGAEVYMSPHLDVGAQQKRSNSILCLNSNTMEKKCQLFSAKHRGDKDFPMTSRAKNTITNENTSCTSKLSRDKKVAKSLLLIITVFCICWSPLSLLMITREFCNLMCIQPVWYEITNCFLLLNSSINPFLYPLCHPAFKKAFKVFLCYN